MIEDNECYTKGGVTHFIKNPGSGSLLLGWLGEGVNNMSIHDLNSLTHDSVIILSLSNYVTPVMEFLIDLEIWFESSAWLEVTRLGMLQETGEMPADLDDAPVITQDINDAHGIHHAK